MGNNCFICGLPTNDCKCYDEMDIPTTSAPQEASEIFNMYHDLLSRELNIIDKAKIFQLAKECARLLASKMKNQYDTSEYNAMMRELWSNIEGFVSVMEFKP